MQTLRLSLLQEMAVNLFCCKLIQGFSWLMSDQIMENLSNKRKYNNDKSLEMMKLASEIGCASDILYLSILYDNNCQYEQSLRSLQKAQKKMSKPYVIYLYHNP